MLIAYLVITFLFGLFAAYKFGRMYEHEKNDVFGMIVILLVLWPIVIPVVLAAMPFYFMARLGEKHKEKALEAEKQKEVKS